MSIDDEDDAFARERILARRAIMMKQLDEDQRFARGLRANLDRWKRGVGLEQPAPAEVSRQPSESFPSRPAASDDETPDLEEPILSPAELEMLMALDPGIEDWGEPEDSKFRRRSDGAPPPGSFWRGLIELWETHPPTPWRDLCLDYARKIEQRSIEQSQRKYEAEGAYRLNKRAKREEKKRETVAKENAVKRRQYAEAKAAEGESVRPYIRLGDMTPEERKAHTRAQQAERKRQQRARRKAGLLS